ncbi:MAG TPA: DUF3090 family protein [Actinomycetota bacterium]|jgi:uncharacterized repeat protein (TIGR03847 family)|nr:DUF3090 family protein [Actinomycetota bacterium]
MSEPFEVQPVSWITTGAVGEPGQRTFFIQAAIGDDVVTLLVEKEQVDALARHVQALLIRLGEERVVGAEATADPAPELQEPLEPLFRVGQMALGYDAERDLVLLQCEEFVPPDEDEDDDDEEDDDPEEEWDIADLLGDDSGTNVRFWVARQRMRSLAARGVEIVAQGRPRCRLCGQPIEPEGHVCPAQNGHREIGEFR